MKKKKFKILLIIFVVPAAVAAFLVIRTVAVWGSVLVGIPTLWEEISRNCSGIECVRYCKEEHTLECFDIFSKWINKYRHLMPSDLLAPVGYANIDDLLTDIRVHAGLSNSSEEEFCNKVENLPDCVDAFARNHLVEPEKITELQKLAKALKSGAKLPGGLTSVTNLDAYCENPAYLEECDAFYKEYAVPGLPW